MAIPGIVVINMVMAAYDTASVYPNKNVSGHATATAVCAFGLPLLV